MHVYIDTGCHVGGGSGSLLFKEEKKKVKLVIFVFQDVAHLFNFFGNEGRKLIYEGDGDEKRGLNLCKIR